MKEEIKLDITIGIGIITLESDGCSELNKEQIKTEGEVPEEPEDQEGPEKQKEDKAKETVIPKVADKKDPPSRTGGTKKLQSVVGRLVQTGVTPDVIYFGLEGLMLVLGFGVYKKKK